MEKEEKRYINKVLYFNEKDKICTDYERIYNLYKQSLEKRKNGIKELITQIEQDTDLTKKKRQELIVFQKGFLQMIEVALQDLQYFAKGEMV